MDDLYKQAIIFLHNGSYNPKKKSDIVSSTATVYLADGTIITFDAMTYPSDLNKFATIPEGTYEARMGIHYGGKSEYPALRVRDIGARNQTIDLGIKIRLIQTEELILQELISIKQGAIIIQVPSTTGKMEFMKNVC